MDVDTRTDTGVEKDNKGSSEGRDEEVSLLTVRLLLGHLCAEDSDTVEHDESGETESSVNLGGAKSLECVDDDSVAGIASVDARDAHELGNLTGSNADTRASHEGAN